MFTGGGINESTQILCYEDCTLKHFIPLEVLSILTEDMTVQGMDYYLFILTKDGNLHQS